MPSEIELTWVVSDGNGSEVSEQYIGALNYWQVFNTVEALEGRMKHIAKKINEAHRINEDPNDWTKRRDSTAIAYDIFVHMKRRMAAEFQRKWEGREHEETFTTDRTESDT
jgi:hypothetical protein